jgi:hypothetical protein
MVDSDAGARRSGLLQPGRVLWWVCIVRDPVPPVLQSAAPAGRRPGRVTRTIHRAGTAGLEEIKDAMNRSAEATKVGIGFGTALAITISWSANHSILWAIIDGIFSWLYVIYYWLRHA